MRLTDRATFCHPPSQQQGRKRSSLNVGALTDSDDCAGAGAQIGDLCWMRSSCWDRRAGQAVPMTAPASSANIWRSARPALTDVVTLRDQSWP